MSECFNNVLRAARLMPIKACIDYTINKDVSQCAKHAVIAANCNTALPPRMWKLFNERDLYGQEHKVSNKTSATTGGVKRVIVSERHASTQSIVHKTTFVPPERLKTLPLRPDEVESGVQQLPEAAVVTPVPRSRTRVSTDAPVLARSASKDKDTRTATSATSRSRIPKT